MDVKRQLNMQELVGTYLFANVPAYLYDTLRDNLPLAEFAHAATTSDLLSAFENYSSRQDDLEDVVVTYCLIVALSFKPYNDVKHFFETLADSSLRWSRELSALYFRRVFAINNFELVVKSEYQEREERL